MRTVLVHFKSAAEQQIVDFLTRTYPRQSGPPWICDEDGDACLYIKLHRHMFIEFYPEDIVSLSEELGGTPTISVSADVSGRHAGDEQVREFVSKLLSKFDGVAQDEYTEGFWTLTDIQANRKKRALGMRGRPDGHTFLDHRFPWHLSGSDSQ